MGGPIYLFMGYLLHIVIIPCKDCTINDTLFKCIIAKLKLILLKRLMFNEN